MRSEREAREEVLRDVGNPFGTLSDVEASLDSYREAVRQAAFAEARRAVEGKRYDVYGDVQGCTIGPVEGGEYVRCADIVAALDALATPPDTGTPG